MCVREREQRNNVRDLQVEFKPSLQRLLGGLSRSIIRPLTGIGRWGKGGEEQIHVAADKACLSRLFGGYTSPPLHVFTQSVCWR